MREFSKSYAALALNLGAFPLLSWRGFQGPVQILLLLREELYMCKSMIYTDHVTGRLSTPGSESKVE